MSDRPLGDAVDQEFRRLVSDIASVPGPAPELDELRSPVLTLEGERTMSQGVKYGLVAAVAAAVAIIVGLVLFVGGGDEGGIETIEPPEQTTTTVVDTTTVAEATTAAPDDEVALGFIETFSLDPGEEEWLEAFAPDVRFTGPELPLLNVVDAEDYQRWRIGYTLNPNYQGPECSAEDTDPEGITVVTCEDRFELWDNLALPGAPASQSMTTTLRIGPDGIRVVNQQSVTPDDGAAVGTAFQQWLGMYYPGEEAYAMLFATDIEAVRDSFENTKMRADEWAEYNDRYGCSIDNWERCGPAARVGAVVTAWIRNEPEALVELIAPDATIGGAASSVDQLPARLAFENAIGLLTLNTMCELDRPATSPDVESVVCRGTVSTEASRSADVRVEAVVFRLDVDADSKVVGLERLPDPPEELVAQFDSQVAWIRENRPDDVATMVDADGNPITTPEAIELWAAYSEEFVAARG